MFYSIYYTNIIKLIKYKYKYKITVKYIPHYIYITF